MSLKLRMEPVGGAREWTPNQLVRLRSDVDFPLDRFYYGFVVEIFFRVAIGVAAADALLADAPQNIIENVRVFGQHRVRNETSEPVNLRGSTAFAKFGTIGGRRRPRVVTTPDPLTVAVGNKDIRFFLPIIFPPQNVPVLQQVGYLLDAPNYEWLELDLRMGDGSSIYDPAGTTTFTFTAHGSGAGNPQFRLHRLVPNLDDSRFGFVPGYCRHWMAESVTTEMQSTATKRRLHDILIGNRLRSVMLKTGTKFAAATAGINSWLSLSDVLLADLKFINSQVAIREYLTQLELREHNARSGLVPQIAQADVPEGYAVFDFAEQQGGDLGDLRNAYNTTQFQRLGVSCWLEADVTGAANQEAEVVYEELVGLPAIVKP